MSLMSRIKRFLPVSSRSFHALEDKQLAYQHRTEQELHSLSDQITELSALTARLQQTADFQQQRDLQLFWQLYRQNDEPLFVAKKRFFKSLPKAQGISKLLQDADLALLRIFSRLCQENHLLWWAGSGTLLGSLLYDGYIPWDDDIDTFMPIGDILKLESLLSDDPNYEIQIVWNWFVPCKQIRFRPRNPDSPCFIDIFPLYAVASDVTAASQQALSQRKHFVTQLRKEFGNTSWPQETYIPSSDPLVPQIESLLSREYHRLDQQIHFVSDVSSATGFVRGIENIDETQSTAPYPLDEWVPVRYSTFCGEQIPIPPCAERYLTLLYGDWTKIPEDAILHDHEHIAQDFLTSERAITSMKRLVASTAQTK